MSDAERAELAIPVRTERVGWVMWWLAFVGGFTAVLWGTWMIAKFWPYEDVYQPLNVPPKGESNASHHARQVARNTIEIRREFLITRDVRLRISRELVTHLPDREEVAIPSEMKGNERGSSIKETPKKVLFRKELETTTVPYHAGHYTTDRQLSVPYILPGRYQIVNVVCWEVNPIKGEKCIDLPDVYVDIKDDFK